jgi:phosphoribosylglycinamide formyltransferase 1
MANLAVFASGNGSNFEAIANKISNTSHKIVCVIYDQPNAYVATRAERFKIPAIYIDYRNNTRQKAEKQIISVLKEKFVDMIALAGFMRLLTPLLIDPFPKKIINIHPSLLPNYPGTSGIIDSYESGDIELGITIHFVDYGLDTGPIIFQTSFTRTGSEKLEEIEKRIHDLEHHHYPLVINKALDSIEYQGL